MRSLLPRLGWASLYLAAFANAIAFVWYFVEAISGQVGTNPVSWVLWLIETGVGLFLYSRRTEDRCKWRVEQVSMIGVGVIVVCLAVKAVEAGAEAVLAPVRWVDAVPTVLAVWAYKFWLGTRRVDGGAGALWVFQLALFAAAVPLIRTVYADNTAEPFGPWALWFVAFILQTLGVALRWEKGKNDLLFNPVNYAVVHGLVAWIVWHGGALL